MPTGKPKTPTAAQIARYGRLAALLRQYADQHDLSPIQLAEALSLKGSRVNLIYKWLGSKGGPGKMFRPRVAKLLGVSPDALYAHEGAPGEALMLPVVAQGVQRRAALPDPLQFTVTAEGQGRIRLDLTLPIAKAAPLLRQILDASELMKEDER
jgi:hypothetical protein